MALKLGNSYMVWVAAPTTFALLAGQQDGTLNSTRQTFDASHKTSGSVGLKIPGLRDVSIDLSFVADLPDTGGYTVIETAHKSGAAINVAVRKDGAAGEVADDVFLCSMYVVALNITAATNGALSGTVRFEPAAAPTTDLTLA